MLSIAQRDFLTADGSRLFCDWFSLPPRRGQQRFDGGNAMFYRSGLRQLPRIG